MELSKEQIQPGDTDDIREVFRHVAPYIIRQWKEVCRTLGLQQLELAQLEVQEFPQSKAYLAYRGLCLWHDHAGKAANRIKLIHALRQCGLYRAEEEIQRLETQKTHEKMTSLSHSPSRQSSASKKRPRTGHREMNGSVPRPVSSRSGSARRASSSKGHRQPLLHRGINACEIGLKITVAHIDPVKEFVGIWKERFNEIATSFYEAVLVNPELHMETLENSINIREISVTDIRAGSLHVRFKILTLGALESLNQMYRTHRLHAICQNVFVTENAMKTICAKDVGIKIEISNEALDKCREFFLTRKFKECVHPTDTLASPSFDSQVPIEPTTATEHSDNTLKEEWRDRISDEVQKIKERSVNFDETMDEFIRTLNIIMPKGQYHIVSLSELLDLYTYLNKTRAVSLGVRVDLFREFLMIVNSIRLIVEEIETKLQTTQSIGQTHVTDEADDNCSIVQCLIDDMQQMLQPDTIFEEDMSVLNRKVNPSEKPFATLICFVPLLLAKLSIVMSTLQPPVHDHSNNTKKVNNKMVGSKQADDESLYMNGDAMHVDRRNILKQLPKTDTNGGIEPEPCTSREMGMEEKWLDELESASQ